MGRTIEEVVEMKSYKDLFCYYHECFSLVDYIHFNSEVTRCEYEKVLGQMTGLTIPITHGGIKDNRHVKTFSESGLVVGFIGSDAPYKGLSVLKEVIADLDVNVMVWGVGIHTIPHGVFEHDKTSGKVHYRGKFNKEQLPNVYEEIDLLVVPSIWKETFSLVTLEALSFGVPVLVSDNVGAQDVIKTYNSAFVYHNIKELRDMLETLVDNKEALIEFNQSILDKPWTHDIRSHAKEIIAQIYINNL